MRGIDKSSCVPGIDGGVWSPCSGCHGRQVWVHGQVYREGRVSWHTPMQGNRSYKQASFAGMVR